MDAGPIPHPADDILSAYRLKQLDERAAGAVRKHLDECDVCRRRVAAAVQPTADVTRTYISPGTPPQPATRPLPAALADHPDYAIKRVLGRGGMGVVYLAH